METTTHQPGTQVSQTGTGVGAGRAGTLVGQGGTLVGQGGTLVGQVFLCKCPRCRQGRLFVEKNPYKLKTFMKMNEACPVCGQPFDIEVGFYFGSSYASYALSIALCAATFLAWWALIGFSLSDNRFFYWMGFNALVLVGAQPILMRVARSLWLALFVRYDRDWRIHPAIKPERQNEDLKNAW